MVELDLQPNPGKDIDPNEHLDELMPQIAKDEPSLVQETASRPESLEEEVAVDNVREATPSNSDLNRNDSTDSEVPDASMQSFTKTKLENDKDKVTEIRKAYYPLVARILLMSVLFDLFLIIIFFIVQSISQNYIMIAIIILILVKIVVLAYYAIFTTFKWSQVYYQFDENRLIKLTGVYNPQETVYNLNNLYSVDAHVSILGRLLKYGHITLVFQVQDGEKQKVEIKHVIEPMECKKYFSKFLK